MSKKEEKPTNEWEKEFGEKFGGYILSQDKGVVADLGIQDFIRSLLSSERQRLKEEMIVEVKKEIYKLGSQENTPYYLAGKLDGLESSIKIVKNFLE